MRIKLQVGLCDGESRRKKGNSKRTSKTKSQELREVQAAPHGQLSEIGMKLLCMQQEANNL